jgi:thiamine biosynthesis lipoprotein
LSSQHKKVKMVNMPVTSMLMQRFLPVLLVFTALGTHAQTRHSFTHDVMGTDFKIVVISQDAELAEKAAEAAFDRLDTLNGILSDYEEDSELSRFSRSSQDGDWVSLSDELYAVLHTSLDVSRRSKGAFDVTLGPLTVQWRMAQYRGTLPRPDVIEAVRKRVGYRLIELDPKEKKGRLLHPSMKLDLGGIAKGYALDETMRILRMQGLPCSMVDGGGDVLVGDPPPGQKGWRVAVSHQDKILLLNNQSAATSGDSSRFVEVQGVRYSHILDPSTGMGMTNRCHATVVAPSGMVADALASTLCVLGPEKSKPFLKNYPGVHALITQAKGNPERLQTFSFGDPLPEAKPE